MVPGSADPARRIEVLLDGLPVRSPSIGGTRLRDRNSLLLRSGDDEPDCSGVRGREHGGSTPSQLASQRQRQK